MTECVPTMPRGGETCDARLACGHLQCFTCRTCSLLVLVVGFCIVLGVWSWILVLIVVWIGLDCAWCGLDHAWRGLGLCLVWSQLCLVVLLDCGLVRGLAHGLDFGLDCAWMWS